MLRVGIAWVLLIRRQLNGPTVVKIPIISFTESWNAASSRATRICQRGEIMGTSQEVVTNGEGAEGTNSAVIDSRWIGPSYHYRFLPQAIIPVGI